MVRMRPGHSLPELVVAVTFLGVALGCVGASTLLGARWAADALRRQEAVRIATAALDSLARVPEPESGALDSPRWRLEWIAGDGGDLEITVRTLDGRRLTRLEGRSVPPIPVLPDLSTQEGG